MGVKRLSFFALFLVVLFGFLPTVDAMQRGPVVGPSLPRINPGCGADYLITPLNHSTGVSTTPTLMVLGRGAKLRRWLVALDANFTQVVYAATASSTIHTVSTSLPSQTKLYWKTEAFCSSGTYGATNAPYDFTTN